jgi:hypothetical protein
MIHTSIPLSKIQSEAKAKFSSGFTGRRGLELCRVVDVDAKNRLVSAYFFSITSVLHGIPYCMPVYNKGCGIVFTPSVGSLGIAIPDNLGRPIILTFTAPADTDVSGKPTRNIRTLGIENMPELLEGELLVGGEGRSFIKFDKLGGFTLSNAIFAYVAIDENGNYNLSIENGVVTVAGTMTEEYLVNYEKCMEIIKGVHRVKTSQHADNDIELCYEIRVGDKLVFGITTDGKVIMNQEDDHGKGIRRTEGKRTHSRGSARRYGRKTRGS